MNKFSWIAAAAALTILANVEWLRAAPAIGPAAATPAGVVVNTATPVVFTAQIADASLIPGSVNLLKTDANGKTLATVGSLVDDGTNGDAAPGDKTFSTRLTINEATVGQTYYRVSAAFKGVLLRTLSNVIVVPVQAPPNQPPVARIAPLGNVFVGQGVALDGRGSSDPEGTSLAYAWIVPTRPAGSVGAITNANSSQATFTPDRAGTYQIKLSVSDGSLTGEALLTFSTVNTPPVASAGAAQTARVGTTVTLDGSHSFDADGDTVTHAWSVTGRPPGSAADFPDPSAVAPTFLIDARGTFTFRLVVTDVHGAPSAPAFVTVDTENSPPLANAGADQTVPRGGVVHLNGNGSTDVDGDALTYVWQFNQRPAGSAATLLDAATAAPSFTADQRGDFVVQLRVSDPSGAFSIATVKVTTENTAPHADAGPDQSATIGATVQLDGTGSTDVDGDTLAYSWSFSSKPFGSQAAISDTHVPRPTFVVDVIGIYTLQLIVGDGAGGATVDTAVVSTTNSRPKADAGPGQSVIAGRTVTLDSRGSSDADGNLLTYCGRSRRGRPIVRRAFRMRQWHNRRLWRTSLGPTSRS